MRIRARAFRKKHRHAPTLTVKVPGASRAHFAALQVYVRAALTVAVRCRRARLPAWPAHAPCQSSACRLGSRVIACRLGSRVRACRLGSRVRAFARYRGQRHPAAWPYHPWPRATLAVKVSVGEGEVVSSETRMRTKLRGRRRTVAHQLQRERYRFTRALANAGNPVAV